MSVIGVLISLSHAQNPDEDKFKSFEKPIKHEKKNWKHPNKMFDTNFDDYCTCDFIKKLGKDEAVDPGSRDINIYYKRLVKSLLNRQQFRVSHIVT